MLPFALVQQGGAEAVAAAGRHRSLLLCWPPKEEGSAGAMGAMAHDAICRLLIDEYGVLKLCDPRLLTLAAHEPHP